MFELDLGEEMCHSGEEGEPVDGLQMMQDIIDSEEYLIAKYYDRDKFNEFCRHNKVEVMMQDDYQFHCYINYKKGDGSYYSSFRNPLTAMIMGIRAYCNHKDEKN